MKYDISNDKVVYTANLNNLCYTFFSSLCLFINNNDVATHTHEHKHIPKYKWNTHIQKSHLPKQTTTQPYFRTVHEFP